MNRLRVFELGSKANRLTLINAMRFDHAGVDTQNNKQYQTYRQANTPGEGFDCSVAFAFVDHHVIQPST